MIKEVWKTFNKSFFLILPLFWELSRGLKNMYSAAEYNVSQLLLEHGLINTYLYKDEPVYSGKLYLLFDKAKFTKRFVDLNTKYFSLCELILDYKYFDSFYMDSDYIVVALSIPSWAIKDIEIIEESKYSKVSDEYKNAVKTKQSTVPKSSTPMIDFIARSNFAFAIVEKTESMKEKLEEALDVKIGKENEYLGIFDKEKECINKHVINKI